MPLASRARMSSRALVGAAIVAGIGLSITAPAGAFPLFPGGPDIAIPDVPGMSAPGPEMQPGVQPPAPAPSPISPPSAPANFSVASMNPAAGETVGVAQPIIIRFDAPVSDHATAERAIRITNSANVPGHFYWFGDKQVRWRPESFWPAGTDVGVDAGGSTSSFHIGDAIVSTADDNTHQITITRNGEVVKTMPTSMGKAGHETPNGTYIVGERFRDMYMDSSTYGVASDSPEGYRTYVEYATRISNNGIFVHAAPWSVDSQGNSDVSHGCLNVSTENGKWFFENAQKGDPVIVVNTGGGVLDRGDGLGDWN